MTFNNTPDRTRGGPHEQPLEGATGSTPKDGVAGGEAEVTESPESPLGAAASADALGPEGSESKEGVDGPGGKAAEGVAHQERRPVPEPELSLEAKVPNRLPRLPRRKPRCAPSEVSAASGPTPLPTRSRPSAVTRGASGK